MKVTLITGASNGIGAAFARRLAADGHNLMLVARSEDKLAQLCDELTQKHSITAQFIVSDLAKADAAQVVFNEMQKRNLEVDWLINNAGVGAAGDFAKVGLGTQQNMITLNIQTLVSLTHLCLQGMRIRKSGTIINLSSVAAFQPVPFMSVYAATKSFVKLFTKGLAEENKPYNIRVVLLCPGATETNFFNEAKMGDEGKAAIAGAQVQTPEQVVDAALKGLANGKTTVVSGFMNKVLAGAGHFIPDALITKVLAGRLRPFYQK